MSDPEFQHRVLDILMKQADLISHQHAMMIEMRDVMDEVMPDILLRLRLIENWIKQQEEK